MVSTGTQSVTVRFVPAAKGRTSARYATCRTAVPAVMLLSSFIKCVADLKWNCEE
jgi:hypothetical protein